MSDAVSDEERVSARTRDKVWITKHDLSEFLDGLKPQILEIVNHKPPYDEEIERNLKKTVRLLGKLSRRLRAAHQKEWDELSENRRNYILSAQRYRHRKAAEQSIIALD